MPVTQELKNAKGILATTKKVRKLLTNPRRWIQGNYVENGSYCLVGAINKVNGPFEGLTTPFLHANIPPGNYMSLEGFNDTKKTTHKKVLTFLDRCIAKAEKLVLKAQKAKV